MTSALLRFRRCAITLFPAFALGCAASGGQTGEETPGVCDETRTPLEADEDSPLGFGADEVLASASASKATLEWLETDPPHGPESGMAELTLSLDALGTAAFVESSMDGHEVPSCADFVEVDVTVTLGTSGGALAETFNDKLRASDTNVVTLLHVFEDGDVDGTLSIDAASLADRRLTRITLEASFSQGALSGILSAGIQQTFGATASFQDMPIACFGPTQRCPER